GGVYFGEPRGVTTLANGEREAVDTQRYKTSEIRRVCAVAFELARKRRNKAGKLHREHYADVELQHMYADALAMQLLRSPGQFDVIVTDNLFGDILLHEASMLRGSLRMLLSASAGAPRATRA